MFRREKDAARSTRRRQEPRVDVVTTRAPKYWAYVAISYKSNVLKVIVSLEYSSLHFQAICESSVALKSPRIARHTSVDRNKPTALTSLL